MNSFLEFSSSAPKHIFDPNTPPLPERDSVRARTTVSHTIAKHIKIMNECMSEWECVCAMLCCAVLTTEQKQGTQIFPKICIFVRREMARSLFCARVRVTCDARAGLRVRRKAVQFLWTAMMLSFDRALSQNAIHTHTHLKSKLVEWWLRDTHPFGVYWAVHSQHLIYRFMLGKPSAQLYTIYN